MKKFKVRLSGKNKSLTYEAAREELVRIIVNKLYGREKVLYIKEVK